MSGRFDFLKKLNEPSGAAAEAAPEVAPEEAVTEGTEAVAEDSTPPSPAPVPRPVKRRRVEDPPAPAPEPKKRGRPPGKRSDDGYTQVTAYIRRDVHHEVKLTILRENKGQEFSELVNELLTRWLKSRG